MPAVAPGRLTGETQADVAGVVMSTLKGKHLAARLREEATELALLDAERPRTGRFGWCQLMDSAGR